MRRIGLLGGCLLLACAGSAPAPHTHYLLRSEGLQATGRVTAPVRVRLGRIQIAPYLDQAGIVVETEAGEVTAARRHRWAEPLEAGLRSYLRGEISHRLGYEVSARRGDGVAWDYSVDLYVDRLHGTLEGTALLEASYRIRARDAVVSSHRFLGSEPLPREGYGGLVEAQRALVGELAGEIAASLQALGESPDEPG